MKLLDYFDLFLTDNVNLNKSRLDELDNRVDSISDALKNSPELAGCYVEIIPQGSWAHRTIIRPAPGLEFDADFLVHLEEDGEWNSDPTKYNTAVWTALDNHTTYGPMSTRKNRCIRVIYANDCHVDVVPYVICSDGRQNIVNRTTNDFEETNPVGFTDWLQEKDDITGGNLRRVIRLLKYLRDREGAFGLKSVLLTTLVGNVVDQWRTYQPDYYKDVPTTLVNLLEDLDSWLQARNVKPPISDPSCPRTSFDHRWTDNQYQKFRTQIHKLVPKVRTAYDEPTRNGSITAWQSVFGDAFPLTSPAATASAVSVLTKSAAPANRAPREEFIEERAAVSLTNKVILGSEVQVPTGWNRARRRQALRSRRGRIPKGCDLRFYIASTDVREPYKVFWKVRNHGAEAERLDQLRGQILPDAGQRSRTETSRYKGRHWIECYIIKDDVCVARAREDVIID